MVLTAFVSRRLVVVLTTVVLAALLAAAVPSYSAEAPAGASLAGQLLIATPAMRDPRFGQAVILMVRHDASGALGIVINKPVGERPLAALRQSLGEKDEGPAGTVRIFVGGPVEPIGGFVLHSTDYHRRPRSTSAPASP